MVLGPASQTQVDDEVETADLEAVSSAPELNLPESMTPPPAGVDAEQRMPSATMARHQSIFMQPQPEYPVEAPPPADSPPPLLVLIVDDNAIN
ncbi:hypothetical protein LTR53_020415, partial [Teratosphaeriaceae sp. CCFEE 6253]